MINTEGEGSANDRSLFSTALDLSNIRVIFLKPFFDCPSIFIRFVPENVKQSFPHFSETLHPYFPSIVENVTVSHGRKAVLKCEVDNLRNYKVCFF